ncbi:MAG: helix-turn-helix domain-containing protein [Bdellovibrionales bacterium]|nr:helix-turn-helix domain-containing protein [Bdellovibrionales bacterium]
MEIDLKRLRSTFRLSQVELAQESGVSLPTIQKIESGQGNPTLEVLEKIFSALGLRVHLNSEEFNVSRAISLGAPLTGKKDPKVTPSKAALRIESRKWIHQVLGGQLSERDEAAIWAVLLALKTHFPKVYSEFIASREMEDGLKEKSGDGKIIKLYRMALSEVSRYL